MWYKEFPLSWPMATQMYWNKRQCLHIRTEQSSRNSHRIGLGHQHGRPLIVLGHQYGYSDVM